jgi:putative ABC transport system substrate-binding protein
MIGPLSRLSPRFLPLLYNRRHFGVLTFFVALAHAYSVVDWFAMQGAMGDLVTEMTNNPKFGQFIGFPIKALGLTGLSILTTDLAAKRLQLLRELVPGATRIAVLAWDLTRRDPASKERGPGIGFVAETEAAGRLLGVEVRAHFIGSAADLPLAFAAIEQAGSQALIVKNNSITYEHRAAIIETSKRLRIPDMYEARELVASGGLVSYGPNATDLYRQAAGYVERILKGTKPADLPVQQPTKVDLVLNLKTAKTIGLTIPQLMLLQADEVIQ